MNQIVNLGYASSSLVLLAIYMKGHDMSEKKLLVSEGALKIVVYEWWDTWHRFAEEGDKPPTFIQEIIDTCTEYTGAKFDTDSGQWF